MIFAGLVAACLMAGCKKENPSQGTSFTAETEQGEANAKTGLVGSDIVWRRGDQIQLKNSSSPSQIETLTVADDNGIGTNKGKFYASSNFNLEPPYTATYRVNISNGAVSLPSTQTLTAANVASPGTIADGLMPMVATSSTNKLPFKNLLGGLCFKLIGSGNLTSIKITSSNTSEKLWGDFIADFDDGTMAPKQDGTGSNELTVNCTGVTLSSTPQYFVVMLPPGTLASNYTVDFTCNGAVISKPATGNANLVQRSKIKTSNQTTNVVPPVNYTVAASAGPTSSYGTIIGANSYPSGASCTVTAYPSSYNEFVSWTENGTVVSTATSYTFTVTGNRTLVANFKPIGALKGQFYVGTWVWFSKGNLQYNNGTTWQFANNQWDRIGGTVQYTSSDTGARDIFGWARNGINHCNQSAGYYEPYTLGYFNGYYYCNVFIANGVHEGNMSGTSDWGYNAISNGGNAADIGWRTLTSAEWTNLLNNQNWRTVYCNSVLGLLIYPYGVAATVDNGATIDASLLTSTGAAFLPVAGARSTDDSYWDWQGYHSNLDTFKNSLRYYGPFSRVQYNDAGYYWSATTLTSWDWFYKYCLVFSSGDATVGYMRNMNGACVRLVKNR